MNQILQQSLNNYNKKYNFEIIYINSAKIYKYKLIFIFSFLVSLILISILSYNSYKMHKDEQFSKKILSSYKVSTLYEKYNTSNFKNIQKSKNISPFIIGNLKIDKIHLNYPIMSQSNSDLLKISLCRFAGPMPNEIGNLCIAGHNYVDNRFFSKLNRLNIDDIIEIHDSYGNAYSYKIVKKYEVSSNNLSCTNQNVNGLKIVTLVTCNNINSKRLVLHAKQQKK